MGILVLALALLASAAYAGPGKDSGSGNSIEYMKGYTIVLLKAQTVYFTGATVLTPLQNHGIL
jgi:hypothetical protein